MSTIASKYDPASAESKWYSYWMEHKLFSSQIDPNKEPYTIVIPPPNVTGVLHMGHMLNNTIQDVLIRRARMQGKNACWVPGTDHASIATEAKVVNMLKEKGIDKKSLTREEFLKYAWEWKEKYGGIILEQLKKLGASCDWDRTAFTMDPGLSDAVISVFVDLYRKGKIYRGVRMVNWDPKGKTALSDDEVITKEIASKLYYIKYQIEGSANEFLTIATTRPETIMADVAICINPNDPRFTHLKGKKAIIPLINRAIPIIEDEYVDMEFGTGCLKVTPAHDINDYELGIKHKLEVIDILNDDGTLNEKAQILVGEDRFIARKKIGKMLEEINQLEKVEDYKSNVGHSERTDAVIEPKLSLQWFLKMEEITQPALKSVMDDVIQLHPPKFKNMYRVWMENVRDWCISRQLWWGHQIPAFYLPNGEFVVAKTKEEALEIAQKEYDSKYTLADLKQDEDVLDTWFSSWLWPISVFDTDVFTTGKPNEELKYYYPTNDLVTAPEILFFWVARMIIAGYEYLGEKPFKNVYLTGIVRDKLGRKMSKSLGNSPDPLELIAQYGADGVRTGMLFSSPAGNDLPYDDKLVEQGRNFANKIWNAFRLVKGWEIDPKLDGSVNSSSIEWFENRFNQALAEINDHFEKFRISDALMTTYKLVWGDFCSWYLEMIKPEYQKPIDQATYNKTIELFEDILKILHPFMPFISEEIWHQIKERSVEDSLILAEWPEVKSFNTKITEEAAQIFEVVSQIRNLRASKGMSPKEALDLSINTQRPELYTRFQAVLEKLANLSSLNFASKVENAMSFVVKADECFVPMGDSIDVEEEKAAIQKELEYTKGFLNSVMKKLSNERFVAGAPAQVVENEKKKQADAEAKIKALEESLEKLG
ncbi:MAG TPA: valine--tRNA ligase [Algoriphagus sp.]|uniref:valine--tRNA ligase n=2 Tax=Algoriphagus TaxID=246875 RepID=UPI000C3E0686|nr:MULTISPECIES: valine--tRNA ligase [unclassified Algoriphagus]MAL15172.1 valine--tRNA ligase [Algoriphagus sp.]HAS57224.1 valine--tRNA ligase [Algoriphagus sp.]HCD88814.1 valine--tRNA ligase [Algoriphagus sp.]|tara:strand:- start:1791 stop:4427 length:2637 start_codon:yes stop_codon:yes gene_type:complete